MNEYKVKTVVNTKMDLGDAGYMNTDNTSLNDTSICRLCLSTKAKSNIFENDLDLLQKIKNFCTLEIQRDDGLPGNICASCVDVLELISNFRIQCHESDQKLKTKLANIGIDGKTSIKLELCYDDNVDSDSMFIKEEDIKDEITYDDEQNISKPKKYKSKCRKTKNKPKCASLSKYIEKKEQHKSNLCTICGKYFEKRTAFYAHARTHKTGSFPCTECSKVFTRKSKLKDHLITHFGVKNIPCDECGKLFASKAYVQKHIDKVHKKLRTVTCLVCMKKLADNRTLKCHMKTHTGEKEYTCDICSKQFTYKFSLQYHMRTHSGEKPYSCRYCFKKFSDNKSSADHQLLHTGETPYKCPVCTKGFAQLSNMKSHFRYNHKGKDLKDYPSYKRRDNKSDI